VIPTIYELSDRIFNSPYAYSSWFARPFNSNIATKSNELICSGKDGEAEIQAELLAKDVTIQLPNDWYTNNATYNSIYKTDFSDVSGPATLFFEINYKVFPRNNPITIHINLVQCLITKGNLSLEYNVLSDVNLIGSPYTGNSYYHYDNVNNVTYL